jgi:RNA polymerase sigma factor (sigma-70 family)
MQRRLLVYQMRHTFSRKRTYFCVDQLILLALSDLLNLVPLIRDTNEATLIANLHRGGPLRQRAERELYERYYYLIRLGERQYSLDVDTSSSVYSDTIISVIDNLVLNRFQSRSSLKSYVHQIFMNKCVDAVRKRTTKKNAATYKTQEIDSLVNVLPDKARTAVQELIEQNDHQWLYQLVSELGDKCREVLMLFEDGYEDKDIAEKMSYSSADVVKTTRLRCLGKLRERFFSKKG